jgi:hypothetical protein
MLHIDNNLMPGDLLPALQGLWARSAVCLASLRESYRPENGTPVFTVNGRYTSQSWTEWTQGFLFGMYLLQYDAAGDEECLAFGQKGTLREMAPHVSHVGVHDHGFNNVSTYGNLLRLMNEGKLGDDAGVRGVCELALKLSGAVQAARWSTTADGFGYIYSFNGPHSLFCDTIRSLRSLALAHQLGHRFLGENDQPISLLQRLIHHAMTTAEYNVYYGEGRDTYDVRGRVAHESLFNRNDGRYRCPSTQQGYSPFSTWTRGLAWIMLGYAELMEWVHSRPEDEFAVEILFGWKAFKVQGMSDMCAVRRAWIETLKRPAEAACDFFIENTPTDGIPFWDTGAPGLAQLAGWQDRVSDPFNDVEPVDSSAAAIAAQGLIRLGGMLTQLGEVDRGRRYSQAGLTVLRTLLSPPYLNADDAHQGLLWHAVYHRPRGWDHVPAGRRIPCGESCLWGDYHLLEAGVLVQRMATPGAKPHRFFT